MERLISGIDTFLAVGGRSPHQVALTVCMFFLMYLTNKLKNKYFHNGLRYAFMQFMFIIYSKYKGKSAMKSKMNEIQAHLQKSLIPDIIKTYDKNSILPPKSMKKQDLMTLLTDWSKYEETLWNGTKHYESGTVYHGEASVTEIQNRSYSLFSVSNPLHPNTFPFIRKMESEIVSMTLSLLNGSVDSDHCGMVSSGGTESIILAIRAYKNHAAFHRNIKHPELVIPISAHAAFDKACDLMGIKLIKVDVESDSYCVSALKMEKYITANTIAIVGSTPQYAQGVIDPIEDLSTLAKKYDIGLHVDCCLGSFLLPLLSDIGYCIPPFDFRLEGVTSISCDTHKFGFCNKGTSVVMFKNKSYRKHAYFCYTESTMGLYSTGTMMGSRSGGLIAATWSTMMYFERDGYAEAMRNIMDAVRIVKDGMTGIEGIEIMGNPVCSVIAFKETKKYQDLNIFCVSDAMNDRGWSLCRCQKPNCIHFCFTMANCNDADKFVHDLRESVEEVIQFPEKYKSGSGAMYCAVLDVPSGAFKDDILTAWLDVVYDIY